MVRQYLSFRAKQGFRVLKEVGWGHLLILIPTILFVVVLGILHHVSTSQNLSTAVILLFSIVGTHWNRKDRFLLEQLKLPLFSFYLLDYILICSPILIALCYWQKWSNLLVFGVGVLIIALFKPSYYAINTKRKTQILGFKWIPLELFEWRSGLRKNLGYFFSLYFIGLALCFYPVAILIVLFLTALLITNFFQLFENKDLLLAVNKNRNILERKSWGSLKLFNLLMIPHYGLYLFFSHQYQHIAALIIVSIISQMLIVFSICMKYKNYRFDHHKIYNTVPLSIFVGCLTLPFLWPVPIIMLVRFWKEAQKNLIYHYA